MVKKGAGVGDSDKENKRVVTLEFYHWLTKYIAQVGYNEEWDFIEPISLIQSYSGIECTGRKKEKIFYSLIQSRKKELLHKLFPEDAELKLKYIESKYENKCQLAGLSCAVVIALALDHFTPYEYRISVGYEILAVIYSFLGLVIWLGLGNKFLSFFKKRHCKKNGHIQVKYGGHASCGLCHQWMCDGLDSCTIDRHKTLR